MRYKGDLQVILPVVTVILFIVCMLVFTKESDEEVSVETTTFEETSENITKEPGKVEVEEITVSTVQVAEPDYLWEVPLDEELQEYIKAICHFSDIEPEIIIAICEKESGCNPAAVGDNGNSIGLMQIQPKWHSERVKKLGCTDLTDPYGNVTVGLDILEELWDKYGKIEMVLMAYNGGCAYAERQQWVSQYALDIMNRSRELKEKRNEFN